VQLAQEKGRILNMCNYDCQYTFHREHTSTHVFFLSRTNGGQSKKKTETKNQKDYQENDGHNAAFQKFEIPGTAV